MYPQKAPNYLGSFTWGNRPAAAGNTGNTFLCTDLPGGNVVLLSNGTVWRGLSGGPISILQCGIYMGVPSSGTIGDNGALSAITALPAIFSGGCYLRFPANAIAAGSAAGMYYCVMSSTTAGTIYNNVYTSGNPSIPASPTPFVTTGPGAYTQSTASQITVLNPTMPGGLLGANGSIKIVTFEEHNNSAGTKALIHYFGGSVLANPSAFTTSIGSRIESRAQNINNQAVQRFGSTASGLAAAGAITATAGATGSSAINTANDVAIAFTHNLSVATDTQGIVYAEIQVTPG